MIEISLLDSSLHTYRVMIDHIPYELEKAVGCSVRRILAAYTEGWAIEEVYIEGMHEYGTAKFFLENNYDVFANIGYLRISSFSTPQQRCYTVHVNGPGKVYGRDFNVVGDIEISTGDKHVCTLTENKKLSISFTVGKNIGYRSPSYEGFIPYDSNYCPVMALYNPIERVKCEINKENIVLEIEANRDIDPLAITEKAMTSLYERLHKMTEYISNPAYYSSLSDIGLDRKIANILAESNIHSLLDVMLLSSEEINSLKNIGPSRKKDINSLLETYKTI